MLPTLLETKNNAPLYRHMEIPMPRLEDLQMCDACSNARKATGAVMWFYANQVIYTPPIPDPDNFNKDEYIRGTICLKHKTKVSPYGVCLDFVRRGGPMADDSTPPTKRGRQAKRTNQDA